LLAILIGMVGFFIFLLTKGQKTIGLTLFICFYIFYSTMALLIWLTFFGCRFFRFFPIVEPNFYLSFGYLAGRHFVWLCFLVFSLVIFRRHKIAMKTARLSMQT
jgi:hypothetical protein